MTLTLKHAMDPARTPDDMARGRFVSALRSFILNDLASDMRTAYDTRAAEAFRKTSGQLPATSAQAHAAMRPEFAFKAYGSCRVHAQKMVWDTVKPVVARERQAIEAAAAAADAADRVAVDPALEMPRNVTGIDVHLMPGGYAGDSDFPLETGAVYDQGLAIFSMGLMGENLDDIGLSMAAYIRHAFPDFRPAAILDVGCTVGHNTLPWKHAYPDADVHAIDVAAPGLIYGAARARMQDVDVQFHQMNAEQIGFPDGSFDLVFSSMFLHELSKKARAAFFREAQRLLRPGGLLLNMELPPNAQMGAFEGFYLDWDCYYNNEPYYKGFRDEDPRELCASAGFAPADYLQFVVPSVGIYGEDAIARAARAESHDVDNETTGRLADGVQWFGVRGVESGMTATPLRPEDAPGSFYGPDGQPQFFQDPAMDRFVAVLLNLTSELWVQTERVETLSAVIARAGLAADSNPPAAGDPAREAALREYVARVLAPLRETAR